MKTIVRSHYILLLNDLFMGSMDMKNEYVDLPADEYNFVTRKKRIFAKTLNNHKYILMRQGIEYSAWKICNTFTVDNWSSPDFFIKQYILEFWIQQVKDALLWYQYIHW